MVASELIKREDYQMPYYAAQIANEFIRRGQAQEISVDPLKIQKLVYLTHGWHLAFLGSPLIRESVEAWRYGPVVPSLYREFRRYGYSTIDEEVEVPADAAAIDKQALALINEVWGKYGRISGIDLSVLTHEPGYAWDLARHGNDGGWSSPDIPNDWIRDEFQRRLGKRKLAVG